MQTLNHAMESAPQKKNSEFLRPHELAARWNGAVSVRTLANWRSQGIGPKFVKVGGRIVYRVADVHEFEMKRTNISTSDYVR
ncbi:helix-turn-helix transcriptional regulator [Pseudomonas fluorescens]|uniref:helix-turn-helix transcriptional regulator n=1 Tax=Pseudomonas fluorescens TaxID=294 RepID=UPI0020C525A2|nr:helix-turn-helix domain-containing protein [Pseudomonas fluorescens]UTL90701.1 helix-turn-helix domain-containing protein [Pseudomonas fluorescens]